MKQDLLGIFTLAKMTPDRFDLTEAGSVLVLQKDSVTMNRVQDMIMAGNVYKNGKLGPDGLVSATDTLQKVGGNVSRLVGLFHPSAPGVPGQSQALVSGSHIFKPGEKFFVTSIDVRRDSVVFEVMSDALGDQQQRYHGSIKFPYLGERGTLPSSDDLMAEISEVVKIDQPQEEAPPAAPPTIALGQTKEEVLAILKEQPKRILQLGPKEVFVFPDMKITFFRGRVANIE